MSKNKGSILLSVIIISFFILTTMVTCSTQLVFMARSNLDQHRSDQAYLVADSLLADSIQKILREGIAFTNPYPDWTTGCLQQGDWVCKMELSLSASGGTLDAWGQYQGMIRHLRGTIQISSTQQVTINKVEEIY